MLIGSVQWVVTLGQYYVQYATNIMARFAQHPIEGHINRAFMVFGYLEHHIWANINIDQQQINTEVIHFIYDNEWK